jgi:cytochrome c oxidase subunit IV
MSHAAHSHDDIRAHVRTYMLVFVSLMVLTAITVGVSYLHLNVPMAVTVALIIAIVKGSLVALFFMHLSNEKKIIYAALVLTVAFFTFEMFIPTWGHHATFGAHESAIGGVPKPNAEGVSSPVH